MKIFCPVCKMYILDTAPAFVCGGPYNAEHFAPGAKTTAAQYNVAALKSRKPEQLPCPRCKKPFIRRDGAILSEHGLIAKGQTTVDMSKSIVHKEGSTAGLLMTAQEWSRPEGQASFPEFPICPEGGKFEGRAVSPRHCMDCEERTKCAAFEGSYLKKKEEPDPQNFGPQPELPPMQDMPSAEPEQPEASTYIPTDEEVQEAERQALIALLTAAGKRVHPNTGLEKLRARAKKLGEKGE